MIYPAKQIREENGHISPMTEWRWWQAGFPRPIKIRGRNFYTSQQRDEEIPAWIERQSREAEFDAAVQQLSQE